MHDDISGPDYYESSLVCQLCGWVRSYGVDKVVTPDIVYVDMELHQMECKPLRRRIWWHLHKVHIFTASAAGVITAAILWIG